MAWRDCCARTRKGDLYRLLSIFNRHRSDEKRKRVSIIGNTKTAAKMPRERRNVEGDRDEDWVERELCLQFCGARVRADGACGEGEIEIEGDVPAVQETGDRGADTAVAQVEQLE